MDLKLSFSDGTPIAKITGGDYDGKILYIDDDEDSEEESEMPLDWTVVRDYMDKKKIRGRNRLQMLEEIKNTLERGEENEQIRKVKKNTNKLTKKELIIRKGAVEALPKISTREVCYVTGPSGSGKSTWCGKYGENYKKLWKKNPIVLFSRVGEDEALDHLDPERIRMDPSLVEEKYEPADLHDSLCIFDDTDTLRDKDVKDEVNSVKDDILETGRHNNVHTIVCSHLTNNYKETRRIMNEMHSFVIFPSCGSVYSYRYCLKKYVGLDKKDIDKILKLKSRWVLVHCHYPKYVLYERGAYII